MNAIQTTPHSAVQLVDGVPMVDSRNIAAMFEKEHKHVLEVIRKELQIGESAPEFRRVEYRDAKGERRPAYLLTKMAAIAIAMSFTGERARKLRWAIVQRMEELERQVQQGADYETALAIVRERQRQLLRERQQLEQSLERIDNELKRIPRLEDGSQAMATMPNGRPMNFTYQEVLDVLAVTGDTITIKELAATLNIKYYTACRRLCRMADAGIMQRVGYGTYRLK